MQETQQLQLAKAAIERGDKIGGRQTIVGLLRVYPRSEVGWLWLSALVDDVALERECLEKVLELNPGNEVARRHLARLEAETAPAASTAWNDSPPPADPATWLPAAGRGFGIRAAAYAIDLVVLYISNMAAAFAIGMVAGLVLAFSGRGFNANEGSTQCLNIVTGLALMLVYFTVFEWLCGGTPGKLLLGMRVIRADGDPCDIGAAFLRGLWRYVDGLVFGLVAYGQMKPPLYQRLGDKNTGTVVVSAKDIPPGLRPGGGWFVPAMGLYLLLAGFVVLMTFAFAIR